ncbi:phosphotransferase family protein [Plantactinospora soyae]|uniref:Aminoglycoside phosphotransferase (APT) family kinase protein n=1 Tax=Plantactinospora soyae TaxID=1544732 RepID=A0A927M497_9ACTN|nr:aminoglycoside phosphotransferase family protein [Plantactinospora soyae]MBE1485213.1 aminoglycoside phosphotransferase (APT) family kinase protein [Plantactinospora soyae]
MPEMGMSRSPFTSDEAVTVLGEACRTVGVPTSGATMIRLGENAIFRLPAAGLIVRISRSVEVLDDARKEVLVSAWLRDAGLPAARTADIPQPIVTLSHPVTFWHPIVDTGRKARADELAAALHQLHGLPPPTEFKLPELNMFGRVKERIDQAADLDPKDLEFLRGRLAKLRTEYDDLAYSSPACAVHGDAHVQNLIVDPAGTAVLIDFERFAFGHRETDLSVTATEYEIGWHTDQEYADFCRVYGYDVRTWDGFPVLRALNQFKMTTWLMQNVHEGPAVAEEFRNRLETLRDPSSRRRWAPF